MGVGLTGAGLCTHGLSGMRRKQSVSASLLERYDCVSARGLRTGSVDEEREFPAPAKDREVIGQGNPG